jgi:hypothetical protein
MSCGLWVECLVHQKGVDTIKIIFRLQKMLWGKAICMKNGWVLGKNIVFAG